MGVGIEQTTISSANNGPERCQTGRECVFQMQTGGLIADSARNCSTHDEKKINSVTATLRQRWSELCRRSYDGAIFGVLAKKMRWWM
jgi:hypothetical protein